jgi:hypothetical protein
MPYHANASSQHTSLTAGNMASAATLTDVTAGSHARPVAALAWHRELKLPRPTIIKLQHAYSAHHSDGRQAARSTPQLRNSPRTAALSEPSQRSCNVPSLVMDSKQVRQYTSA